MRSWVLWNILKFVGNESHKNISKDCTLYWDVYIICTVLINVVLMSDLTSHIQIEHVQEWSYISDMCFK
jgi:hypothetical protein